MTLATNKSNPRHALSSVLAGDNSVQHGDIAWPEPCSENQVFAHDLKFP